jgi:hypothetical protein
LTEGSYLNVSIVPMFTNLSFYPIAFDIHGYMRITIVNFADHHDFISFW